jgi:hypothetical protein
VPVEHERFLTDDDFRRIRALQAEAAMEDAMTKAGSKVGSNACFYHTI